MRSLAIIILLLLASETAAALGADPMSFSRLDLNKDDRISADEARYNASLARDFTTADLNGDGLLDRAEFARQLAGEAGRSSRG